MNFETPINETKTLWKRMRYDWRFWAATTAVLTTLFLLRCLLATCRRLTSCRED